MFLTESSLERAYWLIFEKVLNTFDFLGEDQNAPLKFTHYLHKYYST